MTARPCGLMQPNQPCAKWTTPPRGVCSRQGGSRTCGECIRDMDGPVLGFHRPGRDDHATPTSAAGAG